MKKIFLLLLLTYSCNIFAQEKPIFTFCNISSPVPYAEFIKCAKISTNIKNQFITSFELVFNSVEGVAIYKMQGDTFDETLLNLIEKGKPLKLHLNIFVSENKIDKSFKEVIFQMKY